MCLETTDSASWLWQISPAASLSRVCETIITNTLPIPEDRRFDTLTVLSIAPLIARAINEVFQDGSVTSLFDGAA